MFQNLVWHASSHLQTSDMNASSELGFSWERLQLVAVSDQPALAFWDGWGWGCVGQIKMLSSTWRCAPFKNVVIWKTRVCETLVYIGCGRGKKQLPTQPHDTGVHLGYVLQPCVEYLLVLSLWACLFLWKKTRKGVWRSGVDQCSTAPPRGRSRPNSKRRPVSIQLSSGGLNLSPHSQRRTQPKQGLFESNSWQSNFVVKWGTSWGLSLGKVCSAQSQNWLEMHFCVSWELSTCLRGGGGGRFARG